MQERIYEAVFTSDTLELSVENILEVCDIPILIHFQKLDVLGRVERERWWLILDLRGRRESSCERFSWLTDMINESITDLTQYEALSIIDVQGGLCVASWL